MSYVSGSYFDVVLVGTGAGITGQFTAVTGLNMELEYEIFNEGGLNYPRYFVKEVKPQLLVLSRGVVTDIDGASILMAMSNQGMSIPLGGPIILRDSTGNAVREWTIVGAYLQKYIGPDLDSNQPALAVSRIELIYNGCY